MKTIDERSDAYIHENARQEGYDTEDVRTAYIDGAEAEHKLLTRWNDYTGKVIFERGKFMRRFENVSVPLSSLILITRVVGNIYKTPELLKTE